MPYVSAQYAPPVDDPIMRQKAGEPRRVIATDDQGVEWHLTEDSQVGDWLRYVEAGGTIQPLPAAKPATKGKKK